MDCTDADGRTTRGRNVIIAAPRGVHVALQGAGCSSCVYTLLLLLALVTSRCGAA